MVPPSPTAEISIEGETIHGDPSPTTKINIEGETIHGDPSPTTEINIEDETILGEIQIYEESTAGISSSTKGETSTIQNNNAEISTKGKPVEELSKEIRAVIMVIATLVNTVTYQAILNPPGGFWQDDLQSLNSSTGHTAGYPVSATKHPRLYGIFVAVNASAFIISFSVVALLFVPSLSSLGEDFVLLLRECMNIPPNSTKEDEQPNFKKEKNISSNSTLDEDLFLQRVRKWMNIPSRSTKEDEQKNFPKGRNISSNSTAVVDEINHLMLYMCWVYLYLLLALALWVFQHLRGPGLVAFLIACPSILISAWASIFIPRFARTCKVAWRSIFWRFAIEFIVEVNALKNRMKTMLVALSLVHALHSNNATCYLA